ncbi:MAG: M23 family metallopeptidase [Oscillospiraceae bacterium]
MKKTHIGATKSQRFFSGKGFYIALALSLTAVGGAAWLGVNSAMDKLESPPPDLSNKTQIEDQAEWSLPQTPAEIKKEDVKADTSSVIVEEQANTSIVQGYILPLKGSVLNAYSGEKMVKSKTLNDWGLHTGMDISASVSTPVKSMSGGKIKEVKNDSLWGTTVTIEHADGIVSYYSNLKSAVNVKVNQTVDMGTVIGAVGETCDIERAEESHLHFGVKKDGNWVDPMSVIK